MKRKLFIVFPLLCLAACPSFLLADQSSSEEDTFISLTRQPTSISQLPTNISVITSEEIERSGATTLGDILDREVGVQMSRSGAVGTLASVRLRAVPTANQVQILVDNQPMGGSSIEDFDISFIPVDNIERIEIVRGGASVLYGANTIGGVVNVITKKGALDKPSFTARTAAGSLNTRIISAEKNMPMGPFHPLIDVGGYKTDGYQENSQATDAHASGKFSYAFKNGAAVHMDLFHDGRDLGSPNGTPIPFSEWDGKRERQSNSLTSVIENQLNTVRLGATLPTPWFQLETMAYHSDERYKIRQDPSTDPYATHNDYILGADTHLLFSDGSLAGISYEKDERLSLDQDPHQITDVGAYVQENLAVMDLKLYPAIRYDHHSAFGDEYNPRVTAVLPITPLWKFSANAARSFRSPKLSDLYDNYFTPGFPQFDFLGNKNLKPETAWTYDAGSEFHISNQFSASVTGFLTKINDRITAVDTNGDGNIDTLMNTSRARIWGIETTFQAKTGPLTHALNHTFQEARGNSYTSDDFIPLRLTPRHTFHYELVWKMQYHVNFINNLRYVSRQYEQDGNAGAVLAPYALWNARVEYERTAYKLFVAVDNMLDRLYGESVTFGNPVPQPTRTIWSGVSLKFDK